MTVLHKNIVRALAHANNKIIIYYSFTYVKSFIKK